MSFPALRYLRPRAELVCRRSAASPLRNGYATASGQSANSFRRYVSLAAFVASGTFLTIYYIDSRSAIHRYLTMPLARAGLDPENGHAFAVKLLASGLGPRDLGVDNTSLLTEVRDSFKSSNNTMADYTFS